MGISGLGAAILRGVAHRDAPSGGEWRGEKEMGDMSDQQFPAGPNGTNPQGPGDVGPQGDPGGTVKMPPVSDPGGGAGGGHSPSVVPTIVISLLFGVFGAIPAAIAAAHVRQPGRRKSVYWWSFALSWLVQLVVGVLIAVLVFGASPAKVAAGLAGSSSPSASSASPSGAASASSAAASVPGQTTAPVTTVPAQTPGAVAPGAAETPAATATQEGRMQAQWRESGFTICGQDLAVNGNTTCDFGTAVHDAYSQAVGGAYGSYGSAKTVEAKDAETGGTSTMSCTSGTGGIFCSGDNGVTVVFD